MTKKILHIISSPRGEASVSRKLGNKIVEEVITKYPGSIVKTRDLVKDDFPHLKEDQINLFFTPTTALTDHQQQVLINSNSSIDELQDADIVVIDAPMYNYTITSYLKAYIDHIVRYGVTFFPGENGIEGLIKNKQVYIAVSSGFVYTDGGPFQSFDLLTPYLQAMLGWIGMKDLTFIRAEGMNVPVVQETALQNAFDRISIN